MATLSRPWAKVRAALWAAVALRSARRQLRRGARPDGVRLKAPRGGEEGLNGVLRVVRTVDNTCLERAVVLQHWYAAHGSRRVLFVGVTAPSSGFKAHAWLAGEDVGEEEFMELLRYEAR